MKRVYLNPTPESEQMQTPFDQLRRLLQKSDDYAWSWHCNIAVTAQDEGVSHEVANRIANRFMQSCFQIDTKEPVLKPEKKGRKAKPKKATTNITAILTAELKRIRKSGFNGIRFHELHLSMDTKTRLKDFLSDGLTEAQYEDNADNYCTIMLNPDFDGNECIPEDTEYRQTTNNCYKFYDDFAKHLKDLLGEDIIVSDPKPSCEIEISRRGYKWPVA